MTNRGKETIYLRGSRTRISRSVYVREDGKCFIKFYGKMIEVVRINGGNYATVEMY